MKHKIIMIICAFALLIAMSIAPVYAGDEDGSDCIDGVGDRACSGGADGDGGQVWSG